MNWKATVVAAAGCAIVSTLAAAPKKRAISYEADVKPLLANYCYGCHGESKKKADLSLQDFSTEALVLKSRGTWEKVLHNVRSREMPPSNKPQPSQAERELITAWIEANLFHVDCDNPDPGRVTIRRLNRVEYNNTVRDLVGVDFKPAEDFPQDDIGYGFDNIGDVLSLPPILMEKYLAAAETILAKAVVTDRGLTSRTNHFAAHGLDGSAPGGPVGGAARGLMREGDIFVNFDFPHPGEYVLRVKALGQLAGDEPPRMALRIGADEVARFDVPNEQFKTFEAKVRLEAGRKKFSVAYLNNFVDPKNPDPKRRDRNLIVERLEILSPPATQPKELPVSHRRIFTAEPLPGTTNKVTRQIIGEFAQRAWRRPVAAEELAGLVRLFEGAQSDGENFEMSVKVALTAVLVSPHFLFRGEIQPEPNNPKSVHPINEYALASRLSYFLWSTMPDAELLEQARRGTLRKNLDAQVRRMIKDRRSEALVANFAGQWLQIRSLTVATPDKKTFPEFDAALRTAMQRETELLFETILREDRSVLEFLDADYTFLDERLARHYGIEGVKGAEFRRVSLKGTARGGVLTHGSVLTITSNPTRTSPVKRGKWVLENILGTPPPPPPPDVPELKEQGVLTGTLRQRMEQHRADPNCATCHARMDPIGFGFENFDGVGAWREKDGEHAIDPSGELVSGEAFRGPADLRKILVAKKREEFARCLTEKMLTYALGRGVEYYDKCAVDQIVKNMSKNDFRFSSLVLGITKSVPFQKRRGEAAP